jgi:myosin heavy subunit
MAATNNNSDSGNNKTRTLIIVLGILVVALGGLLLWQTMERSSLQKTKEENELKITELDTEISDLEEKINKLNADLQTALTEGENKQARIEELLAKLAQYESRINGMIRDGKKSSDQIKELKAMLEEVQYLNSTYSKKIAELEQQNQKLTQDKTKLEGTVTQLEGDKQKLNAEVQDRDAKIKAASKLKAADFMPVAHSGGKQREDLVLKRNWIKDKLQICFNLMENPVGPTGAQDIYIVLKDPAGKVIEARETSSGYFQVDGQERAYTMVAKVNYNRNKVKVCGDFVVPAKYNFEKGKHTFEVYHNGEVIGNGDFFVKGTF